MGRWGLFVLAVTGCQPGPFDCSSAGECVVVERSCCPGGSIGDPPIAIHRDRYLDWYEAECGVRIATPLSCGHAGCELCPCFPEPEFPYAAACNAGRCEVVRVRDEPFTECATDAECIRVPRDCGGCEPSGFFCSFTGEPERVGISAAALDAYTARVCGAGGTLPDCGGATGRCVDGRCR